MVPTYAHLSAFVDGRILSKTAKDWLLAVVTALNRAPLRRQIVSVTGQQAAIASTPITLGDEMPGGFYRVSWYLRLTQAATSNSSLTPTVSWVDNGVSKSVSGTAYTGNQTTACAAGFAPVIKADPGTAIEYSVSYGSVGATPAIFAADIVVERIPEMPT